MLFLENTTIPYILEDGHVFIQMPECGDLSVLQKSLNTAVLKILIRSIIVVDISNEHKAILNELAKSVNRYIDFDTMQVKRHDIRGPLSFGRRNTSQETN